MNTLFFNDEALIDRIATKLETTGYTVLADCLPNALDEALYERIVRLNGEFKSAGVGRGAAHTLDNKVRTDSIRWLCPEHPAEAAYLAWMERLRIGINSRLFLGLFDYEAHFAVYQAGDYYRRHLDAFQGDTNRVVSTVFYLNPQWSPEDGGELLIYDFGGELLETVVPNFGTMVIFLSTQFPHEVAVSHRTRQSIAGWFRVRDGV